MAWWRVSIGSVVVVVATVVGTVVATVISAAVVSTVLVIAPPLRVIAPLPGLAAIVTGLSLVVAAIVILALAPMVAGHLLALCYSDTESEWLSAQHRTLALLDRLLLLGLLPKLDKAVAFLT